MRKAACIAAVIGSSGIGVQALAFRGRSHTQTQHSGGIGSGLHYPQGWYGAGMSTPDAHASERPSPSGVHCSTLRKSSPASTRTAPGILSMSAVTAAPPSSVAGDVAPPENLPDMISAENPLRVVIAGGGVGGLLAAKYMKMQGYNVSPTMLTGSKLNVIS